MKGPFFRAHELATGKIPQIDAHMHTALTDGHGSMEDYVSRARELGLSAIAFTEHADDTSVWFEAYAHDKERLRKLAFPIQVYLAAEVKVAHTDGRLALSEPRLSMADFIVGVLHRYPNGDGGYFSFKELQRAAALEIDYRLSLALVANPVVDVFGHPAGVFSTFFGEYDRDKLRHLITVAASHGKVIELNSHPRYRHVFPVILERCLELDCLVSIGSDAHSPDKLGHVVTALTSAMNHHASPSN